MFEAEVAVRAREAARYTYAPDAEGIAGIHWSDDDGVRWSVTVVRDDPGTTPRGVTVDDGSIAIEGTDDEPMNLDDGDLWAVLRTTHDECFVCGEVASLAIERAIGDDADHAEFADEDHAAEVRRAAFAIMIKGKP